MADLLSTLGLPVEGNAPAPTPEPVAAPAPEPTPEPAPPAEVPDEPVVVPEGAKNPDAVQRLIEAERKNAREANARRRELEEQLREREEAALPLEQRVSAATKRAEEAEHRALRYEIGLTHKLPTELVDRLKGTTKDEIERDAKSLLSFLGSKPAPAPSADGGFNPPPPVKADPNAAHNQLLVNLFGRSSGA
jgi:hypothetical protein